MRDSYNTGPAQYDNMGQFQDYLKSLWGGQEQAPAIPSSGIPEGGFAGATGVPHMAPAWRNPDAPAWENSGATQGQPWVNPDEVAKDPMRKAMAQLLAKPDPAPITPPPSTLRESETQMISAPEAPEQLNPRDKRFVGRNGMGRGAKPQDAQDMRGNGGLV